MRLLLDEMLKKTAKWLRIFGIDTEFAEGRDDDELLKLAKERGLALVTRDEQLYSRCVKNGVKCLFVRSDELAEQVAQIKAGLGLEFTFPKMTRCPACNTPLDVVPRADVKGLVDDKVLERFEKFWKCKGCGKVYWEGSHWRNITRIYAEVEELGKKQP
jgi:uncharacterized protein with PIN domain